MTGTSKDYSLTFEELLAWCASNGFIAFAAIVGNLLILTAFICFKKLKKKPNIFLACLALADVLVGFLSVPFWIATLVSLWLETMIWINSWLYKVFLVLDVFSGLASIFHLLLITLERLYAIAWPVRHRVSSKKSYFISSAVAWFIAIATSTLFLLPEVTFTRKTRFYALLFCYLIPLFSICVTYTAIWFIVKFKNHGTNFWSAKKELKLASTIFLVAVLFVLAWTPFMIVNTIAFVCRGCRISKNAVYFTKLLHYTNSALNPLVYALRLPDFKKAITILLRRKSVNWRASSLHGQSSFEIHKHRNERRIVTECGEMTATLRAES